MRRQGWGGENGTHAGICQLTWKRMFGDLALNSTAEAAPCARLALDSRCKTMQNNAANARLAFVERADLEFRGITPSLF